MNAFIFRYVGTSVLLFLVLLFSTLSVAAESDPLPSHYLFPSIRDADRPRRPPGFHYTNPYYPVSSVPVQCEWYEDYNWGSAGIIERSEWHRMIARSRPSVRASALELERLNVLMDKMSPGYPGNPGYPRYIGADESERILEVLDGRISLRALAPGVDTTDEGNSRQCDTKSSHCWEDMVHTHWRREFK